MRSVRLNPASSGFLDWRVKGSGFHVIGEFTNAHPFDGQLLQGASAAPIIGLMHKAGKPD
jgi:hypothetical protein